VKGEKNGVTENPLQYDRIVNADMAAVHNDNNSINFTISGNKKGV